MLFLSAFLFCLSTSKVQVGANTPEIFGPSLVGCPQADRASVDFPSGPLSCSHGGPTDAGPCLLISHVRSFIDVVSANATLSGSHEAGNDHEEFSELTSPFPGSQRSGIWTDALFDEHFFRDPRIHSLRFLRDCLFFKDFLRSGRGLFDFAELHHEGCVVIHCVNGFVDGALNESLSVVLVLLREVSFSVLAVIGFPGVRGRQGYRYPAPAPSEVFLLCGLLLALHSVERLLHFC